MFEEPVRFGGVTLARVLPAGPIFLGATIHDVAQVVGAGYSMSAETGDVATVVKLPRYATAGDRHDHG